MTIKKKLVFSSVLMLALFLVIGVFSWFSLKKGTVANLFDKETMYLQKMLRGVNETIITEGTPESVQIAMSGLEGFDEIHTRLMSELGGPNSEILSSEIDPRWRGIKTNVTPFLNSNIDSQDDEMMIRYGSVIADVDSLVERVEAIAERTRDTADSAASVAQDIIFAAVFIILTGGALLFVHLYRSIIFPVQELTTLAEGFGNGDLSARMDDTRSNEFGALASHFNRAASALNQIAAKITSATQNLASNSTELEATAEHLRKDANEQAGQTEQSVSAITQMSQTILDVARNAGVAAEASHNASEMAVKGRDVVGRTVESIREIATSVGEASATITGLGESSAKIGTILNVINDIADQTNLLALNAAIEAARAGEQGRGFAVVADEVRKLAERTGRATQEIEEMINEIQSDTERTMKTMGNGASKVEEGVKLVEDASRSLESIVGLSRDGTDMVQRIAAAAEEQSSATEQVSHGMESIAGAARRTASSAEQIKKTAENLALLSSELTRMASWFNTT